MGNLCQSKTVVYPIVQPQEIPQQTQQVPVKSPLPKVIVTSEDAALIYLDLSSTDISKRYENLLRRKFPTLISYHNDRVMLRQIEIMTQKKFYFIIVHKIRDETIKSLLTNSRVKAIYFFLDKFDLSNYPKSSKIKGVFNNQMDLKRTIFYHIRRDEVH